jgi:hypothetical protein
MSTPNKFEDLLRLSPFSSLAGHFQHDGVPEGVGLAPTSADTASVATSVGRERKCMMLDWGSYRQVVQLKAPRAAQWVLYADEGSHGLHSVMPIHMTVRP